MTSHDQLADTVQRLGARRFRRRCEKAVDGLLGYDWVDPSTNDGDNGIVAVHLSTPNGSVVLD